jgi:hypothetical protein
MKRENRLAGVTDERISGKNRKGLELQTEGRRFFSFQAEDS